MDRTAPTGCLPSARDCGPWKAYEYTQKLSDKKIGIIGSSQIIFGQYGFYGNDATNEVQFIGVNGPNGPNRLPTICPRLRPLEGLRIHPETERQEDRDHRLEPDHLRPVRLLRQRRDQRGPVHRGEWTERPQPVAYHLPATAAPGRPTNTPRN